MGNIILLDGRPAATNTRVLLYGADGKPAATDDGTFEEIRDAVQALAMIEEYGRAREILDRNGFTMLCARCATNRRHEEHGFCQKCMAETINRAWDARFMLDGLRRRNVL